MKSDKTKIDKNLTRDLLAQYQRTRDTAVRDELVVLHRNLVRYIAAKFAGRSEPLEDLCQVGMIGLVNAIERYDPSHGAQFATFAMPTIIGEIKRYFRDHGSSVKLSRLMLELRPAVFAAMEHYAQQNGGQPPTAAAIAQQLKVSEERVLEVLEATRNTALVSLDAPRSESGESNVQNLGDLDGDLVHIENRMLVQEALRALSERERTIVHGRFFQQVSQSDMARKIGVSQMQVSRLERAALKKMREHLEHVAA